MLNFKNILNPQQYQAVSNLNGPLLIIAGAGSGKTRVITYRIYNMLNSGIKESNILALTFTNKASKEMIKRIEDLYNKKLKKLTISTFHSLGVSILKKYIYLLDYKNNFSIYDDKDQYSLLKLTFQEIDIDNKEYDLKFMLKTFSDIKTTRKKWEDIKDIDIDFYKNIYQEYNDYLKIYNAVDFDDLIILVIRLFKEFPDILEKYQEKFKYILVDEFQDTSIDQYELLNILANKYKNICVVGDDDQSIYSWRGANYKNISNFEKDFNNLIEIKLEHNYRSSLNILEVANSIIANNNNRKDKKLWSDNKIIDSIKIYNLDNEKKEAEFVINFIKEMRLEDRDIKYNDFAILMRTNSLMKHVEEALLRNRIEYNISGGFSFFERSEIKDVIAYLKVITNPLDDLSFLRIINIPRRGIGKITLKKITEYSKQNKKSIFDSINEMEKDQIISQKAVLGIKELLNIFEKYRFKFLSNKYLAYTLKELLQDIEYMKFLELDNLHNLKIAEYKWKNIETFITFLYNYETNPDIENKDIFTYLNNVTLKAYNKEEKTVDNKVNILTIHSSKGLEYKIVFLIGFEEGIIPHYRILEEDNSDDFKSIEEERRLFYVAITRAKERFILTWVNNRNVLGNKEDRKPSCFFDEIPNSLIKEGKVIDKEADNDDFDNLLDILKD